MTELAIYFNQQLKQQKYNDYQGIPITPDTHHITIKIHDCPITQNPNHYKTTKATIYGGFIFLNL